MDAAGEKIVSRILCVDKPAGMTSARCVSRVKRLLPRGTKVGHAGTLDPFATGVLLVLVGRATKLSDSLMGETKVYEAEIKLGSTTPTDDPTTDEIMAVHALPVSRQAIDALLPTYTGTILQRPSTYSAMKINGQRAYELARRGKTVEMASRPVRVDAIEVLSYEWPTLQIRVTCGKGTYIRAIARDLGEALGVGGHLRELRRTQVGNYSIDTSIHVDGLLDALGNLARADAFIIPEKPATAEGFVSKKIAKN